MAGMWGFCTANIRDEFMNRGGSSRTNIGHDLALHELAHWRVEAVNVTMHGQLDGPLCLIPLW
jgi:hypothetical protein